MIKATISGIAYGAMPVFLFIEIPYACTQVPELVYNDGVKILYFNATGTEGGTEEMKSFLCYLENSVKTNVVDSATREMDTYVTAIKENPDLGGYYMTVEDLIEEVAGEEYIELKEKCAQQAQMLAKMDAEHRAELSAKDEELSAKDAEIAQLKVQLGIK